MNSLQVQGIQEGQQVKKVEYHPPQQPSTRNQAREEQDIPKLQARLHASNELVSEYEARIQADTATINSLTKDISHLRRESMSKDSKIAYMDNCMRNLDWEVTALRMHMQGNILSGARSKEEELKLNTLHQKLHQLAGTVNIHAGISPAPSVDNMINVVEALQAYMKRKKKEEETNLRGIKRGCDVCGCIGSLAASQKAKEPDHNHGAEDLTAVPLNLVVAEQRVEMPRIMETGKATRQIKKI